MKLDHPSLVKGITVQNLAALLEELDGEVILTPNASGNLGIWLDGVHYGHLDLATETVVWRLDRNVT